MISILEWCIKKQLALLVYLTVHFYRKRLDGMERSGRLKPDWRASPQTEVKLCKRIIANELELGRDIWPDL